MTILSSCLFVVLLVRANGLLVQAEPDGNNFNMLQVQVHALNATVAALTSRVVLPEKETKMPPIAFFAELGHTLDKPNVGSPVIFDVVHLNDGNAYNNIHGVFTAPVSGLYHFTLELASPNEGSALHKVRVQMMRSWYVVGYVFLDGDGPYWSKSSATATLHLSRGDDIWVKVMYRDGQAQIAGSSYHSIFSGFLIRSV